MALAFTLKLVFRVRRSNIQTQKIEGSILKTFEIVQASFQKKDKLRRLRFFQKTLLLANFNIKMVLKIFFLTFSNTNIKFAKKKLI